MIAAVDTTLHFDSVASHKLSFVLNYFIVINMTALATLELFGSPGVVSRYNSACPVARRLVGDAPSALFSTRWPDRLPGQRVASAIRGIAIHLLVLW